MGALRGRRARERRDEEPSAHQLHPTHRGRGDPDPCALPRAALRAWPRRREGHRRAADGRARAGDRRGHRRRARRRGDADSVPARFCNQV